MDDSKKRNLKQKLKHEFIEYWTNAIYLSIFFSVFIFYRTMILSHYEIYLEDYFFGVVKALIFAKVIMIGSFLRIDRGFENKPLIIPVIYKSFLFTLFIAVFDIGEKFISALIHTSNFSLAMEDLTNSFDNVWIGGAVVVFFSFIPFFSFKELSRVMGTGKIQDMFFRKVTE